jgi:hypothetical protein
VGGGSAFAGGSCGFVDRNSRSTEQNDHVDVRIAQVARRQYGYITTHQLLTLGLTRSGIAHRVSIGRLHRVYQGVYAVGTVPTLAIARAAAAMMACGLGATLSHGSALTLWGLWKRWDEPFEVTSRSRIRRKSIRIHRSKLDPCDVTRHHRFRVTTPARTLLDIAPRLRESSLRRLVNDARRAELLQLSDIRDVLARYPRHPGGQALTPFITKPTGPTRSEFEDGFLDFCERFGLPQPLVNTRLAGYEVDALFPNERLIVELDGYEFHSDRYSFESNRDRDATTLAAGFATVRVTWERLTTQSQREASRLHTILEQRRK